MENTQKKEILRMLKQDSLLSSRYDIIDVIGEGCFGKIIKVISRTNQLPLALKIQQFSKTKTKMVLKNQTQILNKLQGKRGVPKIYQYGEWSQGTYLQMELLDHDLNRTIKYSLSEMSQLAVELIKILQALHSCSILHQDIKPHNIMKSKEGKYFLVDYGLARLIPIRRIQKMKGFIGTPRYASVRAHQMLQQSKKDDLESLFYNLAYLFYRKLPWSKLHVSSQMKLEKIRLLKVRHRDSLFKQMGLQFCRAFDYITSLAPFQEPNYEHLIGLFKRNKTLIIEPGKSLFQQRSKTKKMSLNMSNLLQVPQAQFMKTGGEAQRWSSGSHISSNNSLAIASDVIISCLLQIEDGMSENYNSNQNIQPQLPDTAKLSRLLVMKNPFG